MPVSPPKRFASSLSFRPIVTRATASRDNTAQPALTSGFGAVLEQEEDIQSWTQKCLDTGHAPHSAAVDRILRHQDIRLGANIALLAQRYQMLPHPARFQTLQERHPRLSPSPEPTVADAGSVLPGLIAQHLDLLQKIEALIRQRPDGQRGELILAEIARNHEEMAWKLTALLNEDDVGMHFADDDTHRVAKAPEPREE